jgi:predicted glutamine amidotransferase
MCRMIAFASRTPLEAGPYLGTLSRYCESGNLVARWKKHGGGNHPDGWGVAYREGDEIRVVRSGKPAASDPLLRELSFATDRFIGHVRFASNPETVHAGNSHPFIAAGIALAHNGTFYGKIGAEGDARGVSDTLVFLERLAERWTERSSEALASTLREMLSDSELVGDYSAANLLVAAGDRLFAFRRYRRDPEYYTLYASGGNGHTVVSSQPDDDASRWRPLDDGELIDLVSGQSRAVGPPGR